MQQKQHNRTYKFVAGAATALVAAAMIAVGAPPATAATTHTVAISDDKFTPQNLGNIAVGDTITWKNNGGHNVVSATIPSGATAFRSQIDSLPFSQTFTVPGNYRYYCSLHAKVADANAPTQSTSIMVGQFTVVAGGTTPTSTATTTAAPTTGATATPAPPATTTMPDMPGMTSAPATSAPAITTAPTAPAAAAAATKIVQIPLGKNSFSPQKLEINLGDTVTWKNNDAHNVISAKIPAGAAAFKSPMMVDSAASFSVTPTKLGNYRYYCGLHSTANAANATPQDATMIGEFTVVASGAAAAPAGTTPAGTTAGTPAGGTTPAGQVSSIPVGGVQTGGGSTAGFTHSGLVTLGGGLLMAAFMSLMFSRRVVRQK